MPLHLLDNLSNLSDPASARSVLGLGTTDSPTFSAIASQTIIANTLVAGVDVITVSPIDVQLTLDLTHANKLVRFDFTTDGGVFIPVEGVLNFPVGTVITLTQIGAGKGTLGGDAELILNSIDNGYSSAGQYSAMQIIKVGSDTWDVIGGVV